MHLIISAVKSSSSVELQNIPSVIYSSHELTVKKFIAMISDLINIISWTLMQRFLKVGFFFRALNWQIIWKTIQRVFLSGQLQDWNQFILMSQLLTFQHPSNSWKPNRHKIFTYHWVLAWSQKCGVPKEDQTLQW